jgi:hypothetical protein
MPFHLTDAGLDRRQLKLKHREVEDLRRSLRGPLLPAGEPGYDSARAVWNRAFDRRPALIARCAGAADVTATVHFARTQGLLTAVRGGGRREPPGMKRSVLAITGTTLALALLCASGA